MSDQVEAARSPAGPNVDVDVDGVGVRRSSKLGTTETTCLGRSHGFARNLLYGVGRLTLI